MAEDSFLFPLIAAAEDSLCTSFLKKVTKYWGVFLINN
jgi:hypothetical protein